ncbi:cytochrome P450 [Plantactinospora endophytica]|uniref:Cytochrome P450 n=1 Tax=Plantactinospora endophytica TaxID=673535 RepID=A0ABQ4E1Y3_9ACTN|nr:cytochrome P450 [Plantactinospora endophytica]GIG88352.1 cytochrome P450 [Plantactinospora endophytica]
MTTTERPPARAYPFSPFDGLRLDPAYARLRATEPVSRVRLPYGGEEAWLATRHEDVRLVLSDPRFSRAAAGGHDEPRMMPHPPNAGTLNLDPPEHTRLRRFVAKAFTARGIESLRPRTAEIADELVDDLCRQGAPADLVEHFGVPMPVRVICEMLGVPFADHDRFRIWSEAVVSSTSLSGEQIEEYLGALMEYMADLVAKRRAAPADDLISAMVRARDEHDRLSEYELVDLAAGLLAAGHETTVTQIPNFVYVLLTEADAYRRLCDDPTLVPAAVEELMRFVPLVAGTVFARYATEDVTLGGVLVRAGEAVVVSLSSANRDERVFPEPDRLDFHRRSNPQLGFGHGIHHCFGAQLARMELQVALETLVRRLPGLRLAAPEAELRWKTGMLVRGVAALPVAW